LLEDSGEYEEAIKCYKKLVEIAPQDPKGYYNLGALLSNQFSDYENARKQFEHCIELDNSFAQGYLGLGMIFHFYHFNYALAKEHYRKALSLDPKLKKAADFLKFIEQGG